MGQLDHYVNSSIPEPYTILGVRLKPFCLGHIILMRRFNCGFGSADPDECGDMSDLLLAVAICCRSYEEFLEFVNKPYESGKWVKHWGKKIKRAVKDPNYNMLGKVTMFKEYIHDSYKAPPHWITEEEAKPSGASWVQNILNGLLNKGIEESKVLNMPLGQAINLFYKEMETNGGHIDFMTDEDLEAVETK